MRRLNTVKTSILHKLIFGFNGTPIKILTKVLAMYRQVILKYIFKNQNTKKLDSQNNFVKE